MPPKGAKKGSDRKPSAARGTGSNRNWETGLVTAQFEEESWQACVCSVVGRSPQEEELIRALALAVQQPQRKLFSLLTWDSTIAKIHELGNPKVKKPDNVPVYYEVTEPANKLLAAGEEIPCDLMARILKFQLLQIKTRDQQRRQAEKAEEEKAKAAVLFAGKEKGGAKASVVPSKEKKTKLKRRDEVEPPMFIDDEPVDGPQHYILLLGFYQPRLVMALDAVGVGVSSVIQLSSKHTQSEEQLEQQTPEGRREELSPGLDAEVKGVEELVTQARNLDLFWSGLRPVLDSGSADSKLHDVAQLNYTVPDLLPPFNTQDPEAVLEMGSQIFDGVANLIYDCLDWRRQHQYYLDNIRLINVPTVEVVPPPPLLTLHFQNKSGQEESPPDQETATTPLSTDVEMRYYSKLLDLVPPEMCSVPLVLHCMLEQVVISTEPSASIQSHVSEEPQPRSGPWLDQQLVDYMLQSFLPLVHTEEEKGRMLNSLLTSVENGEDKERLVEKFGAEETLKTPEHPLIIRHHDQRALRLRDVRAVQGFDPVEVELSMMKLSPVWKLIQSVAQQRTSGSCWMAIKQQLHHYCTDGDVSWPEVERLFHQSVFESMPLSRLDQQGVLLNAPGPLEPAKQQAATINPWDNPLSYAKQQLCDLRTKGPTLPSEESGNTEQSSGGVFGQLDLSDIQSCRLRSLFDWNYAEHHDAAIFPQVLQSASEEYRCLDTFKGSQNNILYIFCHNPMSPNRWCKEFWDVALHTDVKFRKYVEHVADTISDWTREEEAKKEAMQLRNLSLAESTKEEKATDSAEDEETLDPVIRKESLKAWKLEQDRLKEEETAKKSKRENTPKGKHRQKVEAVDAKKGHKSASSGKKSTAETAGSSGKTATESITTATEEITEDPFNGFTGYSMDGGLIHVSGCLQYLFPSDGGHITVEDVSYVEGSHMVKVGVKKDGHHFYTHIDQVAYTKQQNNNDKQDDFKEARGRLKKGSFSSVLDNGIHLSYSFYGSTGQYIVSHQATEKGAPETSSLFPMPASASYTQRSNGVCLDLSPSRTCTQTSQITPAELQSKVCKGQPELPSSPFNSLSVSVPNGLLLQFLREDAQGVSSEEQGMLVRQSFPLHARGQLQDPSLSKEVSRIVTSQGAVIRYMRDGSTEVLFADGSVSCSEDSGPVWVLDSEVEDDNTPEGTEENKEEKSSEKDVNTKRGCWLTTTPSGARICTVGTTHKHTPSIPLLIYKTTDPITHETMLTREDLVVSVQDPDGTLVVEHADGTSISTLYQDRPPDTLLQTDTVADNGRTSECGSVSNKERVVLVEKEGCATVVVYPERHMAHIFLADGTVVTGNNNGAYQVFPSRAGLLQIQSDGKCVYSTDTHSTPSPHGGAATNKPGSYTMSHSGKVACDVTDPDGNHFQVMDDGQISVLNVSPAPSTLNHDEKEPGVEEDTEMSRLKPGELRPRLFLVNPDGSGTELLNSQTVEELLYQAYSDPTIALLKEPLPDTQEEFGVTILKPSHPSVWAKWLQGKQNPDITPPNLRNRSWHDFPRVEEKTPGPPFGTDMGRGLTLRGSGGSAARRQLVRSCPKVLEMRELYQHRPLTTRLKTTADMRLKDYVESLMQRERQSDEMMVKDPRTAEESVHAIDLLNLVLSFAEEEDDEGPTFNRRTSVDIASLYSQGVGAPAEHSDVSEDTSSAASESFAYVTESKWTERLTHYRKEMREEKSCREALRRKTVVPYFHPENIPLHQSLVRHHIPNIRRPSIDLPPLPKADSIGAFLRDAPQENTPRPLNPTPSQSASHAAGRSRMPKRRPTNPTPQSAGESSLRETSGQRRSIQVDVTGKPRQSKVRLPTSILGSKPRSIPNQHFLTVEEPVRRKCRTTSLTDPNVIVRGFQLLPSTVDFGTLQEGTSFALTVVMKNVGVDTCRFHVKQPAPATGLRVVYNPGPVPAGLQVELQIQLFPMCAVQAGHEEQKKIISQDVIIHTETDILYLPVTATILCERLYNLWVKDHTGTYDKRRSRVLKLSSSLPVGQGVEHGRPSTLQPNPAEITGYANHTTSL